MASVWKHFTSQFRESAKRLGSENFVSSDAIVNVEALTDALETAGLEWQRAHSSQDLSRLHFARADVLRSVVCAAVSQPCWRKSPEAVDLNCVELRSHRRLLHRLTSDSQRLVGVAGV